MKPIFIIVSSDVCCGFYGRTAISLVSWPMTTLRGRYE
jgi:hypothetical protein